MTYNVTDEQLIDQTAEYLKSLPGRAGYIVDDEENAAYGEFHCLYRGKDEKAPACAAGKWIEDEFYSTDLENNSVECSEVTAALMSSGITESQLPILTRFQFFHDCAENWGGKGISNSGKIQLAELVTDLKKSQAAERRSIEEFDS